MRRPVRPWALQGDGDPPVAQRVQAALSERRAAEVLAETLEPLAVARGDGDRRMEIAIRRPLQLGQMRALCTRRAPAA